MWIWFFLVWVVHPVYAADSCEGEGSFEVQFQSFGTYASKIKFWRKRTNVRVDTRIPTELSLIFNPTRKVAKALLPSGPYSFQTTPNEWASYIPHCLMENPSLCLQGEFKKSTEGPRYAPAEGFKLPCEWYERSKNGTETYLCVYQKKTCVIPVAEFNFSDATTKQKKNLETSMRFTLTAWNFKSVPKEHFLIPKHYVSQGSFSDFLRRIKQ